MWLTMTTLIFTLPHLPCWYQSIRGHIESFSQSGHFHSVWLPFLHIAHMKSMYSRQCYHFIETSWSDSSSQMCMRIFGIWNMTDLKNCGQALGCLVKPCIIDVSLVSLVYYTDDKYYKICIWRVRKPRNMAMKGCLASSALQIALTIRVRHILHTSQHMVPNLNISQMHSQCNCTV